MTIDQTEAPVPQKSGLSGRLQSRLQGQRLDSVITSLSYLATAGLGFVNGPILARALGTTGRGELAAVVATTQLIGFVTGFGMPRAAVFFATEIKWRKIIMSSWFTVLVFTLPFLALLIPAYQWVLDGKQDITVTWFYAYLALTVLAGPATTTIFWLRGMSRTIAFNLLNALPAVLTSIGYVGLFIAGRLTLETALVSTFVAQAIARVVVLSYGRSFPGRGFDKQAYKTQRHYGLRAWFGSLSYLVTFRVDQFVLAGIVESDQLGIYAVAATGATLSLPISRGIGQTLLPHVRRAKTDEARFAAIEKALRWVRLASGAAVVGLAALAPFVVPFLFTEEFAPAVIPLLILLPGQFANDVATVLASALDSFNRPEEASKAQVVSAVITVAGLAIFAPLFGIRGAAGVTTAAYLGYLLYISLAYRSLKAEKLPATT